MKNSMTQALASGPSFQILSPPGVVKMLPKKGTRESR